MAELGRCRSCGARVRWAVKGDGGRVPIDLRAVVGGNVQIRQGDPDVAVFLSKVERRLLAAQATLEGRELLLFTAHHATCPSRDQWRRAAGARERAQAQEVLF